MIGYHHIIIVLRWGMNTTLYTIIKYNRVVKIRVSIATHALGVDLLVGYQPIDCDFTSAHNSTLHEIIKMLYLLM